MNKYVIELRPDCKVVQEICESNGQVSIGAKSSEYLEELNSDYINEHFGYLQDTAYQKGLEDGKAVFDKVCEGCKYAKRTAFDEPCVRCSNAYKSQWKAKPDKIEIGDEVKWDGNKCIVTNRHIDINMGIIQDYDLMSCEGSVVAHVKRCSFVKTGRHFDIEKILEAMKA